MARQFAKKFYHSKEWERCRNYCFQRDNGLCQECLKNGVITIGEEVHHITWLKPSNITDTFISLNPDNCITLCRDCHIAIHKKATTKSRLKKTKASSVTNGVFFDSSGNLVKQKIYIVHGAPGSGKTTYVRQRFDRGDMIVDLDFIKQSISLCGKTDTPDELLDVSKTIRECLYKMIEEKKVNAKTIWVVAMLPTKQQRKTLSERLDAELIHIDADIATCIEHIKNDLERIDKQSQLEIIDQYFGYYEKD